MLRKLLPFMAFFSIDANADIEIRGELKQGGLVIGKTQPQARVLLNDTELMVSDNGDYVFGFGRDDKQHYVLTVIEANGEKSVKQFTPEKREYKEQRINGIKKSIMKPNPQAQARIKKDNSQIKRAREIASVNTHFAKGFIAPIDGIITGVYGSRRVFNGEPKWPHFGLDYAGKTGDPVKSPADGTILLYVADMFYSGGTMIIDHGHGVSSTFLHLSDSFVKVGDKVVQGQVVATVGSTGRATGPHLDWRINWFGTRVDPALALKIQPLN